MSLRTAVFGSLRRWNSWARPTKIGIILGALGVPAFCFSIFAWLMPELGPKILASLRAPPTNINDSSSLISSRVRAAAIDSLEYKVPSPEIVVAKLFREPRISDGQLRYDMPGWIERRVDFISVSPIAPMEMDRTFPGSTCEIEGVVDDLNTINRHARIRLTSMVCKDPSGRQFGTHGSSLGFASSGPSLATDVVDLDFDGKSFSMKEGNYVLRFHPPLAKLVQYKKSE